MAVRLLFFVLTVPTAIFIYTDAKKRQLKATLPYVIGVTSCLLPQFIIPAYLVWRFLFPNKQSLPTNGPIKLCPKCGTEISLSESSCSKCHNVLDID